MSVILGDSLSNPTWDVMQAFKDVLVAKFGAQADNLADVVEILQELESIVRIGESET